MTTDGKNWLRALPSKILVMAAAYFVVGILTLAANTPPVIITVVWLNLQRPMTACKRKSSKKPKSSPKCVNGTEFPVEVGLSPFNTETNPQFISIIRDISKRKRSEEALRQKEAHFRHLFEHSPTPLWVEDFSSVAEWLDGLAKRDMIEQALSGLLGGG